MMQDASAISISNCREIRVIPPSGPPRTVTQLQTVKWPDMTAPEDTKIMRDLVDRVRSLVMEAGGQEPVLVHCSAGVGRTGTFIAVYKLVEEYHDET